MSKEFHKLQMLSKEELIEVVIQKKKEIEHLANENQNIKKFMESNNPNEQQKVHFPQTNEQISQTINLLRNQIESLKAENSKFVLMVG